jgi:hypothetical protein
MTRKVFATLLKTGRVAFLLLLVLFASSLQTTPGFIGSASQEIIAVLRDAKTQ